MNAEKIAEKIKEIIRNIKDIKYTNKLELDVVYSYMNNKIAIGKDINNQINKSGLNYSI